MNQPKRSSLIKKITCGSALLGLAANLTAAPATLLFEDEFLQPIPGWTAVQPQSAYLDGPMLWQYDIFRSILWENSNIYTGNPTYSPSRIAVMLINDSSTTGNFSYTARLTAGDDDGFGMIWGYQNDNTFYRVTFARQNRTGVGWPFTGWTVDRMNNGDYTDLFGAGVTDVTGSFRNTGNRPFDVTIGVTNGLFSLTVVDDPLVSPVVWNLVESQPLPSSSDGKVGLMSWGMLGGTPAGFRVANVALSPTPLAGTTNPMSPTWDFLVTPDGAGNTNFNSVWTIGRNATGSHGRLRESGDAAPNNNAASSTNFAAMSAVAGDVNWTNYVYATRFITPDDDGCGILLRYQDPENFYRVAFRSQSTAAGAPILTGVKRGISIQKRVNGVFDEVFWDGSTYVPTNSGLPVSFDLFAAVAGNNLQIVVVDKPGTANSQTYSFGPFDMTAGGVTSETLGNGKIGVFSWAMNYTDVDFARVYEVSGVGLQVSSIFGVPDPAIGFNDLPAGMTTASVPAIVTDLPGVRRISTGFTGSGSVPASGTTNSVTFNLTGLSFLTWNWRTEYQLALATSGGGQIITSSGEWIPAGTNVTATAQANPGNVFLGWAGDNASTVTNLSFAMSKPVNLTAVFAVDSDSDGLPDNWEMLYFGNLVQNGAGDSDGDGVSDLDEFLRGTNPKVAETLAVSDGLSSQWRNTQRDPGLPGRIRVVDFGTGYRGAYEDSNHHRFADDLTFIGPGLFVNHASFQGPTVVVRTNVWDDAWSTNFSAEIEFTVGDNDGNFFYFRYQNETNWYRLTLCGETEGANLARPRLGLSMQSRVNGVFADVPLNPVSGPNFVTWTDPLDGSNPTPNTPAGFKRVRLTVNATNENFEFHVTGWNAFLPTPDFDPSFEYIATATDASHATGRIGFGFWGQAGFGSPTAVNNIPIDSGALVDNVTVSANGSPVFSETWETAPLFNQFPTGWLNPYLGDGPASPEGDWRVSAHGTIVQNSNFGPPTTSTTLALKGDADGPILLAPNQVSPTYFVQMGFHAFDDDGVGLVYDFQDTNNFSRVLFGSQASGNGNIPRGLTVSRKSNGVWSDIIAGDATFVYTPGRPFEVQFANNNGSFHLQAWNSDAPATVLRWQWSSTPVAANNRFGVATWSSIDAHLLYARAYNLVAQTIPTLAITSVSIVGGNIVMNISKEGFSAYHVQRASSLGGGWTTVASNQTGAQYSEPVSGQTQFYQLIGVP